MTLAVRVVDLDHNDAQAALAVTAQEEAGRVEGAAENAKVRDRRDLPASQGDALGAEMARNADRMRRPAGSGGRRRGTRRAHAHCAAAGAATGCPSSSSRSSAA